MRVSEDQIELLIELSKGEEFSETSGIMQFSSLRTAVHSIRSCCEACSDQLHIRIELILLASSGAAKGKAGGVLRLVYLAAFILPEGESMYSAFKGVWQPVVPRNVSPLSWKHGFVSRRF
jgi:hypothetical protein